MVTNHLLNIQFSFDIGNWEGVLWQPAVEKNTSLLLPEENTTSFVKQMAALKKGEADDSLSTTPIVLHGLYNMISMQSLRGGKAIQIALKAF